LSDVKVHLHNTQPLHGYPAAVESCDLSPC